MYGQNGPYSMGQPPMPPAVAAPGSANSSRTVGSNSSSFDSNVLGLLRNMEKDDLLKLDNRTIDNLISDDAELNKLQEVKLTESTTNRSLAEHSLSQQSRLEQGRRALISAHNETAELVRQHRDLVERLKSGNSRGESMDTLHSLLQSACLEAEDSSESLLDQFLSNRLALPEFVSRYTEARALYHTRRAKADKINEISNQRIVQASSAYRTTAMPAPPTMPPPIPPHMSTTATNLPPYGQPAMTPYYYPSFQQPPYPGGRP